MILKEDWILSGLKSKLERILKLQTGEGWFPEYGGADIGYLSVSLDMLAEYYSLSRDEKVREPINRMVEFLKYFVHPDATVGESMHPEIQLIFFPMDCKWHLI